MTRASDEQLTAALDALPVTEGWGRNAVLALGRDKTFVKRIPVTDLELRHLRSTRNLYRLPTYYNYGIGSAGFGVFRELLGHIETSDWVLEGAHQGFPLLYEHRLVPRRGPAPSFPGDVDGYVRYWNDSRRIRRFVTERRAASHELILFLEYIPHTVRRWLPSREARLGWLAEQMLDTVRFLQARGIIHFDVHLSNLVTDGTRVYLTDFGLVLDRDFELSETERAFWRRHRRYDEAALLHDLGSFPAVRFGRLGTKQRAALARRYDLGGAGFRRIAKTIDDHLEEIVELGLMRFRPETLERIERYRPVAEFMRTFYGTMRSGSKKTHPFEQRTLSRLLNEALR